MWRMLTGRATDLSVELRGHDADETTGTANWVATYTFSTGRHVVNDINASFRFEDGLIAEHDDDFDFRTLGPAGARPGRHRGRDAAAAALARRASRRATSSTSTWPAQADEKPSG